ncbi:hypothetical protein D6D27_01907 [Aureobasidium pullulans]|nr:hypothetical protein D6D27_01907 [Aureobasidium pullulans]THW48981.1 hypothetical protein D6D21_02642 [Aureobasidium pullulans]
MSESPSPSRTKVALTVLFHSSCAVSVTLISKSALNGIEAPVTLLALQTFVQVVLLTLVGKPLGWIKFSRPLSAWKGLIPLMLARLVGILAKTFCLASVDASLYQIARGLLLPFTLLLSHFFLHPRPYNPPLSLFGCGMIMMGFATGMITDLGAMLTSIKGLLLGVGSSFTTAVESVVVKRFLTKGDEGMWQMVWMTNCMALACYLPLFIISGEYTVFSGLYNSAMDLDVANAVAATDASGQLHAFLYTAVATGGASFLLTLATFLQISVTSPTTHMIVTAARGVAQSALAVLILREAVTMGRVWAMVCILGGSAVYAWGKDRVKQRTEKADDRGMYEKLNELEARESEESVELRKV